MQTPRGKVLVVEDERVLASALRRMLTPLHHVTTVTRAEDALQRIEAGERFDVILLDLTLPEMSGLELHGVLTRIAPEQARAIVFMSGGASSANARTVLDGAQNPLLEKPFESRHLFGLLNERIR